MSILRQDFGTLYGDEIYPRAEANVLGAKNLLSASEGLSYTFIKGTARTHNYNFGRGVNVGDRFIVSFDITGSVNFATDKGLNMFFSGGSGVGLSESHFYGHDNGHYSYEYVITQAQSSGVFIYAYIDSSETSASATLTIENFMVRLASDPDDTYVPYAKTNRELTTDKTENSVIAPVESGATASRAYAAREHFIRDGAFCTAKTAIASGAAFTLNTNYTAGTVGDAMEETVKAVNTGISGVTAYKTGRVVTLIISIDPGVTAESFGWYNLGTLPQELQPINNLCFPAYDNNAEQKINQFTHAMFLHTNCRLNFYAYKDHLSNNKPVTVVTYLTSN